MSIIVAIVAVIVIIVITIIFISVISMIIVIIVAHDSKRWERINYHWFEWMPACLRADVIWSTWSYFCVWGMWSWSQHKRCAKTDGWSFSGRSTMSKSALVGSRRYWISIPEFKIGDSKLGQQLNFTEWQLILSSASRCLIKHSDVLGGSIALSIISVAFPRH